MNALTTRFVAAASAILIAGVGALRMVVALRELQRSGSQDAQIAAFTSALVIAGAYGVYRMNRIAAYSLLALSMLLVVAAFMDASVGSLPTAGLALFAVVVACGAVAATLHHRAAALRHAQHSGPSQANETLS